LIAREPDEAARAAWRETLRTVDPADLLFLDETAPPITLTPRQARAPRGQRVVGRVPRGHRPAISWLATLTPEGIGESVVVEGVVDRTAFAAFIEQLLVPCLRPGQVVVLDDLSVHKRARARAALERVGARLLFLPTSSPDFNPIEFAFAKGKQALRRIGPRSFDAVVATVGQALAAITAADARAFSRAAGYPPVTGTTLPPRSSGASRVMCKWSRSRWTCGMIRSVAPEAPPWRTRTASPSSSSSARTSGPCSARARPRRGCSPAPGSC